MIDLTELAWAIARIEQSRDIHLAWVNHLQQPQICNACPPDIGHSVGDVEHHLSVAADYERVLNMLRSITADSTEYDEVRERGLRTAREASDHLDAQHEHQVPAR